MLTAQSSFKKPFGLTQQGESRFHTTKEHNRQPLQT